MYPVRESLRKGDSIMGEKENTRSLFQPFRQINPGVEHLIGMLIEYRAAVEQYRLHHTGDDERQTLLDQCEHKIEEAERALLFNGWFRKKIFVAWDLFHQIVADLILCMEAPELSAYGRKLIGDIRLSSLPDTTKTDSILRLDNSLKKLDEPDPNKADIDRARHVARTETRTLNTHVDSLFWDIWTRKFICLIYTALLFLTLLFFLNRYDARNGFDITSIDNIALLGAMGGLLSGIFSGDIQSIAKGHFWVSTLYYSLVRPVQGVLAAMAMFWMLQSQYLIRIEPPLDEGSGIFANHPGCRGRSTPPAWRTYTSAKRRTAAFNIYSAQKKAESGHKTSVIVLNAAEGKQIYLYVLVLLLAGFSGDKLLKTVSDKVTGRLFTEAEKTKEAK
jgi:hypothetical protein